MNHVIWSRAESIQRVKRNSMIFCGTLYKLVTQPLCVQEAYLSLDNLRTMKGASVCFHEYILYKPSGGGGGGCHGGRDVLKGTLVEQPGVGCPYRDYDVALYVKLCCRTMF